MNHNRPKLKTVAIILLAVLMAVSPLNAHAANTAPLGVAFALNTTDSSTLAPGDVNGDGQISISDYTAIRLHILSLKGLSGVFALAADANGDGQITISDYTLVRLHILGIRRISQGTGGMPLAGRVIGLDPGHQAKDNDEQEPVSPNSADTKKKVAAGTYGRFTGVREYVLNLQVGLKLKARLEALGATVVMTRTTHDVNISNADRAKMMNEAGVDCWLRIHADGNNDPSVYGMSMLLPAVGCMNTSDANVQKISEAIGKVLLDCAASEAGAKNLGLKPRTDQTGFNWSSVPVCNIEMGYMTNKDDDENLKKDEYQNLIVEGLVKGFLQYFAG